ncbi:MAG TPA: ABC transporter ATP-binding protein [Hymenobacter sp.]|uniref:ABC transporter ATP-binding protein n=1 Tax=Hymenobacter sp. TaxID=1898978 RepID=UPI002D7F20B6|nr:ABC transporter ATP-binding protein [Hymenobacter sp.]HET9505892.1 ABC transporter ATP-binding protein [Hymenobacter sp.]
MPAPLAARALTIGYPAARPPKPVAGPLDFTLHPGELVALLGPNGAGKSTLLRTLAGLQAPLAGRLTIQEKDLATLGPAERARLLSIVLTDRVEAGGLTALELIRLGRHPHTGWLGGLSAHDEAQVHAALATTGTTAFATRRVAELSDGERQKVLLARALAQDTPVILLDEPTAHLDLPNRVALLRLLHRLARDTQKAILLSTHELDLALQAADRLALLTAEGALHLGTPEDLVLDGTFAAAFAREGLTFDAATGTFPLHAARGPAVRLVGEGPAALWTGRALARAGYTLAPGPGALAELTVSEANARYHWQLQGAGPSRTGTTVAALLAALRAQLPL